MFITIEKIINASELKEELSIGSDLVLLKQKRDEEIKRILSGKDKRMLLIIGPCSADNEDSVCNYCSILSRIAQEVKDKLLIIPRLYTTKPRSKGNRYRGMLHTPNSSTLITQFNKGIYSSRRLMIKVLAESGLSGADEMLYPENYKFFDDLLSYVTVGSRSSENQEHRLVASGLDVAVGIKNPMSGHLMGMLNSINVAQMPNDLIYDGMHMRTNGNQYAHAVLRGRIDDEGALHSNYSGDDLAKLALAYSKNEYNNRAVIIDANHANSQKTPVRQADIIMEVMDDMRGIVGDLIKGFMVESYLVDGAQYPGGKVYGQSITDGCIGIEKTRNLIYRIAEKI